MHAILFKANYRKSTDFYKIGHEPARFEVWIQATDFEQVAQLESALTIEEALELANNFYFINSSEQELQEIIAQQELLEDAEAAKSILERRKEYPAEAPAAKPRAKPKPSTPSPISAFLMKYGLLILLGVLFLLSYL